MAGRRWWCSYDFLWASFVFRDVEAFLVFTLHHSIIPFDFDQLLQTITSTASILQPKKTGSEKIVLLSHANLYLVSS